MSCTDIIWVNYYSVNFLGSLINDPVPECLNVRAHM